MVAQLERTVALETKISFQFSRESKMTLIKAITNKIMTNIIVGKKINQLTDNAGIDLVEEDLTTRESDVEENVCVS